ncbi:MAG: ABC transporter ATP-binding protein/permease [Gammaproteobacteria bacterium]|nr:ABC transporter ATP-binding protein/permease [Gammaproteobacteria bacterium]
MKSLIYVFKKCGKYWPYAIITPLLMVAEAVLELQIPGQISELITYLGTTTKESLAISELLIFGLKLVGFSLLSLLCGTLGGIFSARASAGFAANLKNALFEKINTFSFTNIDKYSTSSLITRMTTDTNWVQMSFAMTIRMIFRSPAIFVYALIKASSINSKLAMIYLIMVPILVVGLTLIHLGAHPSFSKGVKAIDRVNMVTEENIRGIRVVKSFTREEDEIEKFEKENKLMYKYFKRGEITVNLSSPLMMISVYLIILLIILFGTNLVAQGVMKTGEIYELITYAINILTALMMLSMVLTFFILSKPSRERIYAVLMEEPTIKNPENPITEVKDGSIEFKDVFFKYNESSEKYVLNDINLKINSGETIGILGTTGSSKTTLISMIARLYDVSGGEVNVGGENVKDYDLETLRDAVAVVLQKNVLFQGTIKENLKWGNFDATDEEIVEAAKIAQADSFISLMPDKYDTMIEQGGSNVSGGQKQRLCIARAILKKPKILILDDSMSAVDTKTDALIREGLKNYSKDTTKIIVAQRYLSVMNADKIVIIDNGEIVDIGTHDELLKCSKVYQEVYYSQNQEAQNER